MNFRRLKLVALVLVTMVGCQSQETKFLGISGSVVGTYGSSSLKTADLSTNERDELYNAQKKVYDTAQSILQRRYVESWFVEYQSKNKFATLDEAKKDFYSKNSPVSPEEVQKFIAENASNPQMQQIPEKERFGVVSQYLTRSSHAKAEQGILQKAEESGQIKVTGVTRPELPAVKFAENTGYKYDPKLTNAKVTIVEFADFQCPYCVQANPAIQEILAEYKGKIQYIFHDFPLISIHPQAMPAAIAAKCAADEGKYWEMHKLIFDRKPMDPLSDDLYPKFAAQLGLNKDTFATCLKDKDEVKKKLIMADLDEGTKAGVAGTPAIYINGQKFEENISVPALKREIDRRLSGKM